jgi:uncharacterized protein
VISLDTNLLFAALNRDVDHHAQAYAFLDSLAQRSDVVISELVLLELYVLLRNPVVNQLPLGAEQASALCHGLRRNPNWQVVSLPAESRRFHDALWKQLAQDTMPRRRAFDLRLALSLIDAGVREFATINLKDFADTGFARVWNPLAV